jgi:hypothetical protein
LRFGEKLAKFIRWVMRDTRYHALYPCTVERQDGWGPLELTPDDGSMRGEGLGAVQIFHGVPGLEVRVQPGARVLLGFRAGDPKRPYAALWEKATIIEMRFAGGEKPIARAGDSVTVFWPPQVPVVLAGPTGAFTGTMTITTTSSGLIDVGAEHVKA